MSKIKKGIISSVCLAVTLAAGVPLGKNIIFGQTDTTPTWSDVSLLSTYGLYDTLNIPQRTLSVGGESYEADIKLEYPDGSIALLDGGDIKLTTAGQYTLIYEAKDDNSKYYKDEIDFFVNNKLWSVSQEKSSVVYDKLGDTYGLMVRLARNDTLSFNKTIDLADLRATDALVKGFITPDLVGANDFSALLFTFTDVYDPSKYITIRGTASLDNSTMYSMSYWTAAAPEQALGGYYDGVYRSSGNFGWRGRPVNASFYSQKKISSTPAIYEDIVADKSNFTLSYDKEKVQALINATLINDFDEDTYHTTEPVWYGFTSNKVRLSVQALDYVTDTANFCISSLFGYDFTDENVLVETEKPLITVQADEKYVEYNADIDRYAFTPYAVVGGKYTVPTATAIDAYSGKLKVETRVYHNYSNQVYGIEYPIKNGTFNVDLPGMYAIVYKATDYMGNTAEQIYWVTAVEQLDTPLALTVDTSNATVSSVCGEKIAVADYAITGGSGDSKVSIQAVCGDEVIEVTDGLFIPEKAGTWTVTYLAKDYAGIEVKKQYAVEIAWGSKPVFVDEPILPRYLVPGIEYVVPTVYANDYSSQTMERKLAEVTIKEAQGSNTYQAGEAFTPVVDVDTTHVEFEFRVGDVTIQRTVPTASALVEVEGMNYVYIEKMFVGSNFSATRENNGLTVIAEEDGDFQWTFANPVVANNASVALKGITGQSKFDGVKITFTDSVNSDISVTVYVENSEKGNAIAYIGTESKKFLDGFDFGKDNKGNPLDEFTVAYKLGEFYVNKFSAAVAVDDNGKEFNGFPSNKVYISSEVVNAKKGSGYTVKSMDNYIISKLIMDVTPARIEVDGVYGGMHEINGRYVLTKAYVSDTIDANVTCFVTVVAPNGEIVTDSNGTRIANVSADCEYVIELTQYGQYSVEYKAIDWAGNNAKFNYSINVFDREPPVVAIKSGWSATAKVGEKITLPEVYVTDDASELKEMKIYRYVRTPQGRMTVFGFDFTVNEKSELEYTKYTYTFKTAGEYEFFIVAYDKEGNQTVTSYVVTVE